MSAPELKRLIQKVSTGASLDEDEIESALDIMSSGAATPVQMGAFLMALRVRGETVAEITGAARLLRRRMLPVEAPAGAVDIVGTGGDSHGTYNVSTCAAIVAAGAGGLTIDFTSTRRAPVRRSPRTATARYRRSPARRTCSARSASSSTSARRR